MEKKYRVPHWFASKEMEKFIKSQDDVTITAYMRRLVLEDMKKSERKDKRKTK